MMMSDFNSNSNFNFNFNFNVQLNLVNQLQANAGAHLLAKMMHRGVHLLVVAAAAASCSINRFRGAARSSLSPKLGGSSLSEPELKLLASQELCALSSFIEPIARD